MQNHILNIGIVAHVDAGKTTLTEQLLFQSGAIRSLGSVDKGSTITDSSELERKRGITIKNAGVSFNWNGSQINVIDTPGHIDFAAEVDRAISILDGVVLVVSAVEGVQAHTLNLWENLKELNIPVLIFVNKIDRMGADPELVVTTLEKELQLKGFCLTIPEGITTVKPYEETAVSVELLDRSYENLSDINDTVLNHYLEGTLNSIEHLETTVQQHILKRQLTPICFGIAKSGIGITAVMDAICKIPSKNELKSNAVNAQVFKVEHHEKFGKLAHIRVYSGLLKTKQSLYCSRLDSTVKINQLLQNKTGKLESISSLKINDIGIIAISDAIVSGDILGKELQRHNCNRIAESVLTVQVEAVEAKDYQGLATALQLLDSEDPSLEFAWYKDDREFHLKIMGPMQSEILNHTLKERFGIETDIKPPQIIYKETPASTAEGYVRYWMPKPCWAILTFKVEAGAINSGIQFTSLVGVNAVSKKYQNEVERAIPRALRQGIKGWPVTDLKITLLQGEEHTVHSNPGDFLLATPMGIMSALENAGTQLLEPFYNFEIKANQELLGSIAGDLNQMNASIGTPNFEETYFTLKGTVAVANAIDYSIKFNASTSGKGRLKLKIGGYQPTENSEEKHKPYKGVNPLDEAQWILHNRGAYKADERL